MLISHKVNKMSTIDLYQVLRQIPNVTEEQAKHAATSAGQSERLHRIETELAELRAEFRTTSRITLALLLVILAVLLAPLLQ